LKEKGELGIVSEIALGFGRAKEGLRYHTTKVEQSLEARISRLGELLSMHLYYY